MKRRLLFIVTCLIVLISTGCCLWNPNEHYVRINLTISDLSLSEVRIGGVGYGELAGPVVSAYRIIDSGQHSVEVAEQDVAQITLKGWGTHYWTVTIDGSLVVPTYSISED